MKIPRYKVGDLVRVKPDQMQSNWNSAYNIRTDCVYKVVKALKPNQEPTAENLIHLLPASDDPAYKFKMEQHQKDGVGLYYKNIEYDEDFNKEILAKIFG